MEVCSLPTPTLATASMDLWLGQLNIAVKEVITVILAAAYFVHQWAGKVVQYVVDNKTVVDILQAMDLYMMHLVPLLVFLVGKHNFWFTTMHIPGKRNIVADALSRNNMLFFHSQDPEADIQPTQLSTALVSLVSQTITWTSTSWIKLFRGVQSWFVLILPQVAQHSYLIFCIALTPLPTSGILVCYFVACLGQQGLAHSFIQTFLSGVRQLQISYGFSYPEISQMQCLRQTLRDVKVKQVKVGKLLGHACLLHH